MSRKSPSILLLMLALVSLAACRVFGPDPAPPTPALVAPTLTQSPNPSTTVVFATAPAQTPPQTNTPTPSPTAIPASPTVPPPTSTPVPPTATVAPPTAAPPTPTPNSGPPPGGTARIVFGPGATSAVVQSTLAAGGDTDNWTVRVQAGQIITIQTLSSAPGAIDVSLRDAGGSPLASNLDTTAISAAVPATGDYQITFSTPFAAGQVSYTAQVSIPPAGGPAAPTRIQFAPGASVAQINDALAAGGDLNQYILHLGAGQVLSVGVFASVPAVTNIAVRDNAGRLVTSGTDMSGVSATTTTAGDFFIDISSGLNAPAVSYLLTVNAPPAPADAPQRITFGPGQTSATVNGQVRPDRQARYVLRANAGQLLVLSLSGQPINTVDVTVSGPDGAVLSTARDPLFGLVTDLPASGDYTLMLSTAWSTGATYVMDVVIPPPPAAEPARIAFATGATSAMVSGGLDFGGDVDAWVVRAAAGQSMQITAAANPGTWMNLFVYDAAGRLVANGDDTMGVAFPVPASGDYTILVATIQAAPPVNYSLTVSLPPGVEPTPGHIVFGPGQTSATVEGQASAEAPTSYVISMTAGQTLLTDLTDNPPGTVDITVEDADGNLINFGRGPTQLSSRVPVSGDVRITLDTTGGASAYTLRVTAPPLPDAADATRIIFAVGSTTTVAGGFPATGGVNNWILRGQAGQTLSLFMGASRPGQLQVFVYNAAGDIIALGSDLDVVSAPLAAGDDYHIVIVSEPAAEPVSYSMVVEIP